MALCISLAGDLAVVAPLRTASAVLDMSMDWAALHITAVEVLVMPQEATVLRLGLAVQLAAAAEVAQMPTLLEVQAGLFLPTHLLF